MLIIRVHPPNPLEVFPFSHLPGHGLLNYQPAMAHMGAIGWWGESYKSPKQETQGDVVVMGEKDRPPSKWLGL